MSTYPEVFSAEGVSFSVDPYLDQWVGTWITADGLQVERNLGIKMRPGPLTDAEELAVINAYRQLRFGADFDDLGVRFPPKSDLDNIYQDALSQTRGYAAKWSDSYEAYAADDGFNRRLLEEVAYDILGPGDFAGDAYENPTAEPLTDEGKAKLDAVFAGLGYADRATDGNVWGDVIDYVADRLGLIPDPDDYIPAPVDDIEKVSKIVWDANTPEEARELAEEAGIVGEENLLKAEGIWFRDEWKHGTDAFEELFPTYGEGNWATNPNDFLEADFDAIVDGDLSVREASDWWKDYGKRLHDVEEATRAYNNGEAGIHELAALLAEHGVEVDAVRHLLPEADGEDGCRLMDAWLRFGDGNPILITHHGDALLSDGDVSQLAMLSSCETGMHGDLVAVEWDVVKGRIEHALDVADSADDVERLESWLSSVPDMSNTPTPEEIASFGNGVRIGR